MTFKSDIWLLLWIGLVALVAYSVKLKRKETVLGQETEQYNLFFAIIIFLPVFLFVSIGEVRGDVGGYLASFAKFQITLPQIFQNWWGDNCPGFTLIKYCIKEVFGNDRTAFRIVIALIQSIPLVLTYRKYSEDYVLSIFLFITMGYYDGWMMNGLRQFVAANIILLALPLILKKKAISSLLIILLAMTIHSSAIMMIPIVLVIWFKPWSGKIIFCFIVFIITLFIYIDNNATNLLHEEILKVDDGSNPIRIFISAIPCVVAYIGRKRIAAENNMLIDICVNMSVFTMLIYFVATFTNGIGTGRLPIYTGLFNLILIPHLCKSVFDKAMSKRIKIFLVLFYIVYFFVGLYYA